MADTPTPVALLGLPYDASSSFLQGSALAPNSIREALASDSSNRWSELGIEVTEENGVLDAGNATIEAATVREDVERAVRDILGHPARVFALGGDHSITYPVLKAYEGRHEDLTIVHFDAHSDLYDEFQGDRWSHACPFARIMEEGLAARLVQVGIRTQTDHLREQAERFGVEVFEMSDLDGARTALTSLSGPLYVSFDLDVIDPAFAPGVSHWEPGGMSTREAISLIHAIGGTIVGADLVEYNPHRDAQGITATTAAKLVKELAAKMLR